MDPYADARVALTAITLRDGRSMLFSRTNFFKVLRINGRTILQVEPSVASRVRTTLQRILHDDSPRRHEQTSQHCEILRSLANDGRDQLDRDGIDRDE